MAHLTSRSIYSVSGNSYDDDETQFPLIDSVILDSGATVHIFNDRTRFMDNFREADASDVCIAGSHVIPIEGWGSVMIQVTRKMYDEDLQLTEVKKPIRLDNVAYIPSFHVNVAALWMFMKKDIHWDTATQELKYKGRNWANMPERENQWVLEYNPPKPRQLCPTEFSAFLAHHHSKPLPDKSASAKAWHRMMGHLYRTALEKLPEMTTGCKLTDKEYDPVCEGCELKDGSQNISHYPRLRATTPFETVHLDLIQMRLGIDDETQVLHGLCDLVQENMVYTLPGKSQDVLVRTIQDMVTCIWTRWSCPVRILYLDGERSLGNKFDNWTKGQGIIVYHTPPYTKEPNGNIKRSG
jgi:hypothetical protein